MYVLGIDPGSRKVGYACLLLEGNKITYIASGAEHFKSDNFFTRLESIHRFSQELFQKFKNVQELALESLIFVKNPASAIKLSQARGVLLSSFLLPLSGKIFEYPPNVVKSVTSGHGHASKLNVQKILSLYVGKQDYISFDESDAVAIAVCHSLQRCKLNPWPQIRN